MSNHQFKTFFSQCFLIGYFLPLFGGDARKEFHLLSGEIHLRSLQSQFGKAKRVFHLQSEELDLRTQSQFGDAKREFRLLFEELHQ
jgi:hypothetical protein